MPQCPSKCGSPGEEGIEAFLIPRKRFFLFNSSVAKKHKTEFEYMDSSARFIYACFDTILRTGAGGKHGLGY